MGMEPFKDKGYPNNLMPSFILRSRREVNTIDATNSRFVNYWQNDTPQISDLRPRDTNPTSSRLYREDLNRSQPYVSVPSVPSVSFVPSASVSSASASDAYNLEKDISNTLQAIQRLKAQDQTPDVIFQLKEQGILYNSLIIQKRNKVTDSLASNPYFDKYYIAGDSRNVIRELRGVVSEGVVDRGVMESQKLFKRSLESRWVQPEENIDSVSAFELLRPRFNQMETNYTKN